MDNVTQLLMRGAAGAAGGGTFVDDVFSTYLYEETGSTVTVNNSVDMSKGGMVWFKNREANDDHALIDTVRGGTKVLFSNKDNAQETQSGAITSFNNNGFTIGNYGTINGGSNKDVASWTFRKAPGFFDIQTWTGGGETYKNISHNLGSVPGCIIVKKYAGGSGDWFVFHRNLNNGINSWQYRISLDNTWTESSSGQSFLYSAPTATQFQIGDWFTNSGTDYIAYVFAGGASTDATARSVDLDGTGDYLSCGSSSDFSFGTGDFTIEGWFKKNDTSQGGFWQVSTISGGLGSLTPPACAWQGSAWQMYGGGDNTSSSPTLIANKWYHIAQVRSSGVTTMYVDGVPVITRPDTANYDGTHIAIGGYYSTSFLHEGKISNFRVVKGTAVYTSSFRPPYEPLTNITNTVLLCCNNSSVTGSTVTPGTITANGNPTASIDSPFDDPEGFKFGKGEDQNIIKCGSYEGNGTTQHIDIGFEAQWVLIKNIDTARNWVIADSMRGAANNPFSNAERALFPNDNSDEVPGNYVGMYERGFRLLGGENSSNTSGDTYVYMAFRRPDGYVGKPPELGTDVFNMPLGLTDGTKPAFNTGFPVDFLIYKKPAVSGDWFTGARSIGINYLETNDTAAQATNSNIQWDFQDGMGGWSSLSSGYQSWSWKRHAGFDVVTYEGNGVIGRQMPHSLGVTPEMIWVKRRNANEHWYVYHKGVNGGTNPGDYMLYLDDWTVQIDHDQAWNNSLPTSTHFILGNDTAVNSGGTTQYMAMLFASVDGISKVGRYTGSTSTVTVTTGFSPRFVIIKRTDVNDEWVVLDTVRGWGSGNDPFLYINHSSAQNSNINLGAPTSTGFTVTTDYNTVNTNGGNFIYYAHA